MWRVEAEVHFSQSDQTVKNSSSRIDPLETLEDDEFIKLYRLTKSHVLELSDLLHSQLERSVLRSGVMDPAFQICVALRYYAQGGYLPCVGDIHGISPRSCSNCIHSVSSVICDYLSHYVSWPDDEEINTSKENFLAVTNYFPNVFGAVDGIHVPINAPSPPDSEAEYVNRRDFHSINCQVLCDSKQKIYDFNAKWPGSCEDAYVLRRSRVFDKFESGLVDDAWVVGDLSYKLTEWMLVPLRDPSSGAEERFNAALDVALSAVQQCKKALKMRWKCLTRPITFRPERAARIMKACAILHNFLLKKGVDLVEEDDEGLLKYFNVPDIENCSQPSDAAIRMRFGLIQRLSNSL